MQRTTVTVSGAGEVIRDRKLMVELWDASWNRWFPSGPEPKDVALLRVLPEHVERHDGRTGRLSVLFTSERRRGTGRGGAGEERPGTRRLPKP